MTTLAGLPNIPDLNTLIAQGTAGATNVPMPSVSSSPGGTPPASVPAGATSAGAVTGKPALANLANISLGGVGFGLPGVNLSGLGLGASGGSFGALGLPEVSDPDKTFAAITRQEYADYVNNFRGFEQDLINRSKTDTGLIDQARQDAAMTADVGRGIAVRNAQRYGVQLTPAQMRELERTLQRENTLGGIQQVNDAKLAQREQNSALMMDLVNIGQGVQASSLEGLSTSAANKSALDTQYKMDRAATKNANRNAAISTVGSLGALAILAFAI